MTRRKAEAYQRLSFLCYCLAELQTNPGISDPEVRPAAEDFLNGRIAELEQALFGQKEKAAGQGDSFFRTLEKMPDLSIPAWSRSDKVPYSVGSHLERVVEA
ncbi:hypothetical protein [Gorillibacterium sp. sgz5001074]|uniref:hypothetical protein n=1 Tax=Gorillibacterium sp. sgz5001074 TaxID=3446695 RepID=UPI003F6681B6